jgi:PleD family two-component response regulator
VALAFSAPAGGPEAILREADAAMYFAKRAGGARHHVFGKDTQP